MDCADPAPLARLWCSNLDSWIINFGEKFVDLKVPGAGGR